MQKCEKVRSKSGLKLTFFVLGAGWVSGWDSGGILVLSGSFLDEFLVDFWLMLDQNLQF